MIAPQAVRAAPARRMAPPRPRHTARLARPAERRGTTWEVRAFVVVSVAIACLFVVAMLYLTQATAVATRGYEAQGLEQTRDELRRQNALLEVENARLDSPVRIEAEANRIGLVRAARIPVIQLEPISAKR